MSECPVTLETSNSTTGPNPVLEKYESALLILLGFGGFSIILALIHNAIRKHIFHDEHSLDTTFDAGGDVSTSLTAVTVASQLFWPADILQSATITTKIGIAGPFWYSVSVILNIFIFPIFSVHFKTRAPGAKTYLQIIYARFGKKAHIVFCCFALLTNMVIMTALLLAGKSTIQSLTKDISDEYTLLIMATLFGSYSLIGGIGTTFYVSYFNACLIFISLMVFVVNVLHNSDSHLNNIGDAARMFNVVSCVKGPEENTGSSFLTFRSGVGILYGVIGFFVASAVTYCDQASWQSRIAAKPMQGVWGFFLAGFMWLAIPSTMATTTGIAYLAISSENSTHLLTSDQIDQGLVTPFIAEKILGPTGGILILTILSMALMSTGSGEVMAISSIIVYDIYQTYIKPFRQGLKKTHCILCGKHVRDSELDPPASEDPNTTSYDSTVCHCQSVSDCKQCAEDMYRRVARKSHGVHSPYRCTIHGPYRTYQNYLIEFKNWCIVWVTVCIIPFGLLVFAIGIDLNWIFYVGAIVTIPCFPAVILSIVWVKATSRGLISGGITGLLIGVAAMLGAASTYEGGLHNFLLNTSQDYSILAGTCCSFGFSLITCMIVSVFTHKIKTDADADAEWKKMFDIDNPLHPWEMNLRKELKQQIYNKKPSSDQIAAAFRQAKITAYVGGSICITLVTFIIPGIMATFPVLDETKFEIWVGLTQAWAVIMGVVAIVAPPVEEIVKIRKQYIENKKHVTEYPI
ncbi:urea-proton symporter DUR3-like [Pecten maximus]|uniref:urea-proton symporter DUR3-like n=1 Tax=Pecten maximus TaxID=6579 RepID=UPI00145860D3|nr:urea-proton symporter DUR3-like [Pecten maximus]